MASKYEELSSKIVGLLGGRGNITYFTHCVTRLRFNVKNRELVDGDAIGKLSGVLGNQWSGDQYQVIIGTAVADAYKEVLAKNDLNLDSDAPAKADAAPASGAGTKKFRVSTLFETLSGCMAPVIPVLIAGGLLQVLVVILTQTGLMNTASPTVTTLNFASNAAFYFLPIYIGYTGTKKFGGNPLLGMLLGAILVHPTFVAMVAEGAGGSVFGLPIYAGSYASSVFPMLLSTWALSTVEKFIAKHSPDAIKGITEPLGTMLVMIPLSLCLLAPIGSWLGIAFANIIVGMYDAIGPLAVALLAALMPILISAGMHTGLIPYMLNSFATLGYEALSLPGQFVHAFAEGAACLAIVFKTKNAATRSLALGCVISAFVGGVTEPALFGITMKNKSVLKSVIVGTFTGALLCGFLKVSAFAFPGSVGPLGLICLVGEQGNTLVQGIICCLVGFAVTFVTTMLLYKEDAE